VRGISAGLLGTCAVRKSGGKASEYPRSPSPSICNAVGLPVQTCHLNKPPTVLSAGAGGILAWGAKGSKDVKLPITVSGTWDAGSLVVGA